MVYLVIRSVIRSVIKFDQVIVIMPMSNSGQTNALAASQKEIHKNLHVGACSLLEDISQLDEMDP